MFLLNQGQQNFLERLWPGVRWSLGSRPVPMSLPQTPSDLGAQGGVVPGQLTYAHRLPQTLGKLLGFFFFGGLLFSVMCVCAHLCPEEGIRSQELELQVVVSL